MGEVASWVTPTCLYLSSSPGPHNKGRERPPCSKTLDSFFWSASNPQPAPFRAWLSPYIFLVMTGSSFPVQFHPTWSSSESYASSPRGQEGGKGSCRYLQRGRCASFSWPIAQAPAMVQLLSKGRADALGGSTTSAPIAPSSKEPKIWGKCCPKALQCFWTAVEHYTRLLNIPVDGGGGIW